MNDTEQGELDILVVDDDNSVRETFTLLLNRLGFAGTAVSSGAKAVEAASEKEFDIAFIDYKMPGMNGLEVIKALKESGSGTELVLMTAYASIKNAVEALKLGASDYITKPFEVVEIKKLLDNAARTKNLLTENVKLKSELKDRYTRDLVGVTPSMQEISEIILKAAKAASTVLIEGESGTGKELVARAIHYAGPRSNRPFVVSDCSAINPNLIESELFGHETGAYTGAGAAKKGLIREAHTGTLFLDEIGELPPEIQVKLLRLIQDKSVKPVGSSKTHVVDLRVIAATNRDMAHEMSEGNVRKDFYYRLNVIPIKVPPLRERLDDIPLLVKHFTTKLKKAGMEVAGVDPEVIDVFKNYTWPGNVRELENVLERAAALGDGKIITVSDVPEEVRFNAPRAEQPATGPGSLKELEKNRILEVMRKTGGNVDAASKILNIHRTTLYRKLKKYKLN